MGSVGLCCSLNFINRAVGFMKRVLASFLSDLVTRRGSSCRNI